MESLSHSLPDCYNEYKTFHLPPPDFSDGNEGVDGAVEEDGDVGEEEKERTAKFRECRGAGVVRRDLEE